MKETCNLFDPLFHFFLALVFELQANQNEGEDWELIEYYKLLMLESKIDDKIMK